MFSSTDLKQKEIKDTLDIDQLDNDFNKLLAHMFDQVQGRSQEETTTEANTRSVVRNQPYEIF